MMKILATSLLLLSAHPVFASSSSCQGNLEAQFIAQYNHINLSYAEAGNAEHTDFDMQKFSDYQVNPLCPLMQEDAEKASIRVDRLLIGVNKGDSVSGVLVYNPTTNQFHIE